MIARYIRRILFRQLKKIDLLYTGLFKWKWRNELRLKKQEMRNISLKTKREVMEEIRSCEKYWHCRCDYYYYYYELYKRKLTNEELLNYVPPYYFANKHQEKYQRGIDTVKYADKLEQFRLFVDRGITTPWVEYVIKKHVLYDAFGGVVNTSSITGKGEGKLFIKPTGGQGGYGIQVATSVDDMLQRLPELPSATFVVQKAIIQRRDFADINSSSVNTLRVVVHVTPDNRMELKVCILRMGRNGSDVDNSAQGGISIAVNIENGMFADYATAEHGGGTYYAHPDSGFVFKGNGIRDWGFVKGRIEDYATKLSDFKDIALDVAVLENDVTIIEFNFGYGIDHIQTTIGGVRRIMDVELPR